ncbi:MAG: YrvL family regulatory protein [Lachnospiraceae bacterium]
MNSCKYNKLRHNRSWFMFTGVLILFLLFLLLYGKKVLVLFGIYFDSTISMILFSTLYIVIGYYCFRKCMSVPDYLYRRSITENRVYIVGILLNVIANVFFIAILDHLMKSIHLLDVSTIILAVFLTATGDFYYKRSSVMHRY